MEQLGAEVIPVTDGTATLKDAINAAMRDWAESMENTHYVLGTTCGPHPVSEMVSYFQSLIGEESKPRCRIRLVDFQTGYMPVGGGSNASGIFLPFLEDKEVSLVGVEAGGHGIETENMLLFLRWFGGHCPRIQNLFFPEYGRADAAYPLNCCRIRLYQGQSDFKSSS